MRNVILRFVLPVVILTAALSGCKGGLALPPWTSAAAAAAATDCISSHVGVPPCATAAAPTEKPAVVQVSGGTVIGEVVLWLVAVAGTPLAAYLVLWIRAALRRQGVEMSDADRARLQEMVEHAVAFGAQRLNKDLSGKMTVEVKSSIARTALDYVQEHGAETLARLGADPGDEKTVEALQARIAKALADRAPQPAAQPSAMPPTIGAV